MFAILFSIFLHLPVFADAIKSDGFQTGTRLMQEQKYEEASKQFEAEYRSGKNFAALYFNWGLSEYRLGKKGLSIALWRRALFVDPELSSAQQALAFIENELPSPFASEDLSGWTAFRVNILDRVSLNKLLFLCWIFFITASLLLIRYWGGYRRAIKNMTPLPKIPAVGLLLFAIFIATFGVSVAKGFSLFETRATVISTSVPLRTGPNTEDNSIFDLTEGFDVVVGQVQNSWVLITITSGVSGWVPTETLFQHTGKVRLW